MSIGKSLRMKRIFRKDGKALIVAMDHAYIFGPIKGLESPRTIIEKVLEADADAIMTTYGVLKNFSYLLRKKDIGVILRVDGGGSMYSLKDWGKIAEWNLLYAVKDAVKLGVDGIINMVLVGSPSEPTALKITAKLAKECDEWGMPFACEIIPVGELNAHDPEIVATICRIAAEYGADMIKTIYPGNRDSFRKVVEACYIPVLIAGGPKMESTRQVLKTVKDAIDAGGAGVFFGRNVWQHKDPVGMIVALSKIIHENCSVDEAMKQLSE